MEASVDVEGNEGYGVKDCVSPQEVADPVVYQLVRVDGNGVLVPATDDEVLAVEDLLEDCQSKVITSDTGQTLTSTDYGCGPGDSNSVEVKGSEGHEQLEAPEGCAEKQSVPPDQATDQDEKKISSPFSNQSEKSVCQSGSLESCSKLSDRLDESRTSSASVDPGLRPDFSLLNGEIHLECLSVRDLQETFRATFGRGTSVKDKQWLKRRIIMGLTNSCDFSITSFTVLDNKVVKKGKDQVCKNVDCSVLVDGASTSATATESHTSPIVLDDNPVEIHPITNETNLQSSNLQDTPGSQEASMEQSSAKRIRKPTKRYIEELSDGEPRDSATKFVSSFKQPSLDQSLSRPAHNVKLDGKCLTRKDSFGGSGIQVPYVSRVRRSRPRRNFASLMKLHLSDIGISTQLEKNHVTTSVLLENESGNEVLQNSLSPRCTQEPTGTSLDACNLTGTLQLEKEAKKLDSHNSDDADDEVVNTPNSIGGMRRKHHRPWTLTEVVKLVEGVAEHGAGRWSDIKRLAFASYSYRTSVDLKDKWRNLLRASLSESATGNGIQGSRKQVSIPIPASILSRVRELANIHSPTQLDSKAA